MPRQWQHTSRGCRHPRQRRGMRLMLRPSLLMMLRDQKSHGYDLYDQLADFGFQLEQLDSSIVYRDLREMEDLGLINSNWDDDSKGPKKRVYSVTDLGLVCLQESMDNLTEIQTRIDYILSRYKERSP